MVNNYITSHITKESEIELGYKFWILNRYVFQKLYKQTCDKWCAQKNYGIQFGSRYNSMQFQSQYLKTQNFLSDFNFDPKNSEKLGAIEFFFFVKNDVFMS